ncbi:hypothetical protein CTAYLR_008099 [Chrysophaeum taylorii]|uniref:Myb-like domain-containing protein n=1 Tax=Chrysophaeum taylorii TaxID=2483200 RepID=A0AAD7XJQ2_9STRA|nr:hypothetical protein CTAYLR_008099 [Chrysophaeum taylorii]
MVPRRLKPFEVCQLGGTVASRGTSSRSPVVVPLSLSRTVSRSPVFTSSHNNQAIALVDDTLGLIGMAVVEAMHSTKPHGDYKILYVHAFVARADLRKRPGSQEARREELRPTLGERASVPFWIANKAAHFNEKKFVSIVLQNSYNEQSPLPFLHRLFPCRNQSPIFAGDDSTPPMGYSVRHTLRAKNLTDLCARLLQIFRASTISEIRAIRDKFPIHHFKAETRIEDVMKSVFEARVDSRASAEPTRADPSRENPARTTKSDPNDLTASSSMLSTAALQMREHLSIVHDLLLYRVPRIVARLQEIGFEVEKTITSEDCDVGPDGIAYPSVVEAAAAAVGAPQTVAGLFIVLAHYTLVPRSNELELLPLAREQQQIRKIIRSAIVRASAGQTNDTNNLSCLTDSQRIICGKPPEGAKGEFFACSAYLIIDTYSNHGRRGLCSNGAHISCLNYYMRFNLIPGVRPAVGAMFCSVRCQVRGVALKLRIVHHPDDPDILFVPQIEFPGALPAAMLLSTQITRVSPTAETSEVVCDRSTPWSDYESKRHASHLLDAASLTWSAVSNEHADRIPAGLPPLPPPSLLPPPPAFEEHLEMLLDNDEPTPLPQEAQVPPVDGTVVAMSDDEKETVAKQQQQHTRDVAAQNRHESNAGEPERFVAAVKKYDAKNWKLVAREVGNRTDLQCANHYYSTYEAEYVARGRPRGTTRGLLQKEIAKCDAWNHVYDLEGGTWELPSTVDPDVPIHQLSLEDYEASLDAYFAFEAGKS